MADLPDSPISVTSMYSLAKIPLLEKQLRNAHEAFDYLVKALEDCAETNHKIHHTEGPVTWKVCGSGGCLMTRTAIEEAKRIRG